MFCSLSVKNLIRNERPWVASRCRRREGRSSIFTPLPTPIPGLVTVDVDDDEGRINFSVALSPKTTRTRNNKPKQ